MSLAAIMRAKQASALSSRGQRLLYACVFFGIIGLVLYPVGVMLVNSFVDGHFGPDPRWSMEPWKRALAEPSINAAIRNTLRVVFTVEVISLPCAILIAWLIARSDMPGGHTFEFMFWIAFFVPVLSATMGWIVLLDPQTGLINQLIKALTGASPFDIYSFWGIVWAHLATNAIAVKVMLLTPVFRNIDAALEEAARVSGGGRLYTLRRVVLPLAAPGIATVFVLAAIRGMQTFEIEQVLGAPSNFWVFGTLIYRLIEHQPPEFGQATVLASLVIAMIVPLILLHRWLLTRREYATIGGRMRVEPMALGLWRWPMFALVLFTIFLLVVLPAASLAVSTFMKLFGFFNVADPWTLANWRKVLNDDFFVNALFNTFRIAGGAALLTSVVGMLIAYFVVRGRHRFTRALDFASWLPFALPGILFGVGLLYAVLGNPVLKMLYGSVWILILAVFVAHMTLGVQVLKAAMVQLGAALEESARASGASWFFTMRKIVVPLLAPSVILVAVMSFVSSARDISTIALLGNNATKPLSLLQLDYIVDGRSESAAVISTVLIILTVGLALLVRLGLRRFANGPAGGAMM